MNIDNTKKMIRGFKSILTGEALINPDPFDYLLIGVFAVVSPVVFPICLLGSIVADAFSSIFNSSIH